MIYNTETFVLQGSRQTNPLRSAVISFMSTLGPSRSSSNQTNGPNRKRSSSASFTLESPRLGTPDTASPVLDASPTTTPPRTDRRASRPASTIFSSKPPQMEVAGNTPAELQPIFAYLNSHANKLYHEGYFLKLNDLDTRMYPCVSEEGGKEEAN